MKIFCFTQFSRNFPVKMKMRSPPSVWIFVTTTGCVHGLKTPFSPRNPPKTSRLPSARSNCMAFSPKSPRHFATSRQPTKTLALARDNLAKSTGSSSSMSSMADFTREKWGNFSQVGNEKKELLQPMGMMGLKTSMHI